MGWLDALGGIGTGISAGAQDLERMKQQKFLQEQMMRARKEWQQEDAADTALQGISMTEDAVGPPTEDGKLPQQNRKQSDILRDKARAVQQAGGRKNLELGIRYEANADQAQDRERQMEKRGQVDAALKKYQGLQQLLQQGKYQDLIEQFNANGFGGSAANDHIAIDAGDKLIVANRSNGRAVYTMPKDPQQLMHALRSAHLEELSGIDPEYVKLQLENEKVGNQGDEVRGKNAYYIGKLGIDKEELDAKKPLWEAEAKKAMAEAGLSRARAGEVGANLKAWDKILGQDENGTVYGLTKNGQRVSMPLVDDSGKPIRIVPKLTGDKGNARSAIDQDWAKVETELVKQGSSPEEIEAQQIAFKARRGIAPPIAEDVIRSGVNPKTKKPLTAKDVEDFNKRYPHSAVDPSSLSWLQKDAARAQRVAQIPQ